MPFTDWDNRNCAESGVWAIHEDFDIVEVGTWFLIAVATVAPAPASYRLTPPPMVRRPPLNAPPTTPNAASYAPIEGVLA